MREKFPVHGIYYTIGSHDLYPINMQDFSKKSDATKPLGKLEVILAKGAKVSILGKETDISLTELHYKNKENGELRNPGAVEKFKEYGYYALYEYIHTLKINSRFEPVAP